MAVPPRAGPAPARCVITGALPPGGGRVTCRAWGRLGAGFADEDCHIGSFDPPPCVSRLHLPRPCRPARRCLRRGRRRHLRQGPMVRALRRDVRLHDRAVRPHPPLLLRAQEKQGLQAGVRLQRQDLLQRLLPARLQDSQVPRRQMQLRPPKAELPSWPNGWPASFASAFDAFLPDGSPSHGEF
jgi:hypothetical protein